jgi:hypothetical protein
VTVIVNEFTLIVAVPCCPSNEAVTVIPVPTVDPVYNPEEFIDPEVVVQVNVPGYGLLFWSTAEAEKHCRSETNHSWINDSGVSHEISLGAKALREILEKQEKRNDQRIIFHRGDFPFVTSVRNLVGFVQWETACDSVAGEFATSGERSLASLNTALSLDQRLRSLSDVDLVFLGPDFSDMNGN